MIKSLMGLGEDIRQAKIKFLVKSQQHNKCIILDKFLSALKFSLYCLAALFFTIHAAHAQEDSSAPETSPYYSWCPALPPGTESGCFQTPRDMCQRAMEAWYPDHTDALVDIHVSTRSATCKTDRSLITSRGSLWIGDPGGSQRCEGGLHLVGGYARL